MEYKYTGIILNKKDIGETDRIYNIYTLEQGKISAIARGVRKSKSKLAGHLENFYLIDLTVMKNRGMGNIASSIVENNFKNIRNDLDLLERVFKTAKIINRLINDQEKDTDIFFLFLDYLDSLNKIGNKLDDVHKNLITQGFIFKFLDLAGYKIEINKCVRCEQRLSRDRNFFDYSQGGIVCEKCAVGTDNILPISNNSIKIIRIIFQNKIKNLSKLKIGRRESTELEHISKKFIKWIC
ncbi:MAG: repair protein RecO protein [Candidatus Moranbacteria bacterium GW2011_GWF2_34_56]|nr:MAG: repair protein RecO protein [Candidatus Moranbacteria bacterium GW2011_GWF1_34_10]KKP63322.1 MAG: repair protein RecO protein [Candidatus Moranbacteria bacterium GW2011_GWF2_34_56]HBI16694.1 DNA repair protein RecO [Candidatus Moranbacteria bacterium]